MKNLYLKKIIFTVLSFCIFTSVIYAKTIYVDSRAVNGKNNGVSWKDALIAMPSELEDGGVYIVAKGSSYVLNTPVYQKNSTKRTEIYSEVNPLSPSDKLPEITSSRRLTEKDWIQGSLYDEGDKTMFRKGEGNIWWTPRILTGEIGGEMRGPVDAFNNIRGRNMAGYWSADKDNMSKVYDFADVVWHNEVTGSAIWSGDINPARRAEYSFDKGGLWGSYYEESDYQLTLGACFAFWQPKGGIKVSGFQFNNSWSGVRIFSPAENLTIYPDKGQTIDIYSLRFYRCRFGIQLGGGGKKVIGSHYGYRNLNIGGKNKEIYGEEMGGAVVGVYSAEYNNTVISDIIGNKICLTVGLCTVYGTMWTARPDDPPVRIQYITGYGAPYGRGIYIGDGSAGVYMDHDASNIEISHVFVWGSKFGMQQNVPGGKVVFRQIVFFGDPASEPGAMFKFSGPKISIVDNKREVIVRNSINIDCNMMFRINTLLPDDERAVIYTFKDNLATGINGVISLSKKNVGKIIALNNDYSKHYSLVSAIDENVEIPLGERGYISNIDNRRVDLTDLLKRFPVPVDPRIHYARYLPEGDWDPRDVNIKLTQPKK